MSAKTKQVKKEVKKKKGGKGFASMDAARQREIASHGGKAISQNRQHRAEIGRRGGSR
jgi:general stress protein YciG